MTHNRSLSEIQEEKESTEEVHIDYKILYNKACIYAEKFGRVWCSRNDKKFHNGFYDYIKYHLKFVTYVLSSDSKPRELLFDVERLGGKTIIIAACVKSLIELGVRVTSIMIITGSNSVDDYKNLIGENITRLEHKTWVTRRLKIHYAWRGNYGCMREFNARFLFLDNANLIPLDVFINNVLPMHEIYDAKMIAIASNPNFCFKNKDGETLEFTTHHERDLTNWFYVIMHVIHPSTKKKLLLSYELRNICKACRELEPMKMIECTALCEKRFTKSSDNKMKDEV